VDDLSELEDFFANNEKYARSARSQEPVFNIDLNDLHLFNPELSMKLVTNPKHALQDVAGCLRTIVDSNGVESTKKIRVINLIKTTEMRNIESVNVGQLIQIEGIIISISTPYPEPTTIAFTCPRCGFQVDEPQDGVVMRYPKRCLGGKCRNTKFGADDMDLDKSQYENVQRIEIQERPEDLTAGEIPESLPVLLRGDLIRAVTPGDRAKIVGVLKSYPIKPRKMEFMWVQEANSVTVENKDFDIELMDEEIKQFNEMSQDPHIMTKMVSSFAPSIYGWDHIKEVLLLGIFGGEAKVKNDSEVRGNINVFLLGDAGTSKSQLLRYCHKLSHRGIFSTGRGVTGVGLTVALCKEGDRFVLRAGSMPLADMGICCIDEAEKMNKEDRDSVHTPMEQQIVPVNKGGINTTLNARCATFMAANPTDGRYNQYKTISENIKDFPDSLLSRFDFIYVMPDIVNEENDNKIADRILRLKEQDSIELIPFTTLKKYIVYSKRFHPTIPDDVGEYLKQKFLEKRSDPSNKSGLKISWRQLESLERACEARARAHLRETVTIEDAEATVRLFEIYIQATWTDPFTGKIDMNVYEGMPPTSRVQQAEYVPRIIEQICRDGKGQIGLDGELYVKRVDLINEMKRLGELDGYVANQILDFAIKKDLVWPPGIDRIKITGDKNQMLGSENKP